MNMTRPGGLDAVRIPSLRALVLALLAVLPTAALPLAQAEDPAVGVTATPIAGGLSIRVAVDAPGQALNVVVSHEDPLLGEVVDRVVPIVTSGREAEVEVRGLRSDVRFSVRVLPASGSLPRLSPVLDMVDGGALASLPSLGAANVERPPPVDEATVRAFPAFPVAHERGDERTSRVLVTRSGIVVVAWMEPTDWYSPTTRCALHVAASRDGGRTYSANVSPREPMPAVNGGCEQRWAVAEAAGGEVLLVEESPADDPGAYASLYDPAEGRFVSRERIQGDLSLGAGAAAAPLPDGSVALAVSRGALGGRGLDSVSLWRLDAQGRLSPLASFGGPIGERMRVASSGVDDLAVVWVADGNLTYALSRDGGRTFAQAVVPREGGFLTLTHATLDAFGVLHVTAANHETGQSYYLRHAPGAAAETRPVCGDHPRALQPACVGAQYPVVASSGGRVWLLWEGFVEAYGWQDPRAARQYAAESTDGGVTFAAPYAVEDFPGNRNSVPYDAAILPDGRPILLGYYFFERPDGREDAWIATVPVFDPLAAAADGFASLRNATLSTLTYASPRAGPAPQLVSAALQPPRAGEAEATLVVVLRNAGDVAAADVRLSLQDLPAPLAAAPPEPFRLGAAGSVLLRIPVSGWREWNGTDPGATLVLAADGEGQDRLPLRLGTPATGAQPLRPLLQWARVAVEPGASAREAVVVATVGNAGNGTATGVRVVATGLPGGGVVRAPPVDLAPGERRPVRIPLADLPFQTKDEAALVVTLAFEGYPEWGAAQARVPLPVDPSSLPAVPTGGPLSLLPRDPDAPAALDLPRGAAAGAAVAVVAVTAVALATEAGRISLLAAATALYSRIARSQVLANEVRAGVHARIRERPGERFEALRRDLGLGSGTLSYHLRVLQREGYVSVRREWTSRRFYPSGAAPPAEPLLADAAILRALRAAPSGLTPLELARALGISRQLARYHLMALARSGHARATPEGRTTRFAPAASVPRPMPVRRGPDAP